VYLCIYIILIKQEINISFTVHIFFSYSRIKLHRLVSQCAIFNFFDVKYYIILRTAETWNTDPPNTKM